MPRSRYAFLSLLLLLLATASCDNVGRAFDPSVGPPPAQAGNSAVSVVQTGGDTRDSRPTVKATYPTGSGWQPTVPIVVEFSESVNEKTVGPSTPSAQDAKIVLRLKNTTQNLPCSYDFLANGRLLVMRPTAGLSPPAPTTVAQTYQVVLLPDARDADGVTFDAPTAGTVLAEFQPNQATTQTDGRILAVFPRDNTREATRETDYFVVFDRPANAATLVASNLVLRPTGGSALAAAVATPLSALGVVDPRVVRLRLTGGFAASTEHQLVVNDSITFGADGTLDFNNRTPFARFTTIGPGALSAVQLDNAVTGFPNKINRANLETVRLRVTTPADAVAGDRIRARIYGGNSATQTVGDLKFVERTAVVPEPGGAQTVLVDFAGRIGTIERPAFDEGDLTFVAQMQRGSQSAGFIRNSSNAAPSLDATPPAITRAGPPGSADGRDLYFDTAHLAFHGTAGEEVAEASLTDGVNPAAGLFASDSGGRFLLNPIPMGRLASARPYVLTVTDSSGNLVATPFAGNLVQRGYCTGAFAGTLEVEAYDQATLQPIAGATVLLDAGAPVVPAVGQLSAITNAAGRATFSGLGAGPFTVTIVSSGHDLITLYQTQAAVVSLPLRPRTAATATLQGTATFVPGAGVTAIIGNTAFDDRGLFGVRTNPSAATTIPDTLIVPNRPQAITSLAGVFEATATPTFSSQGIQMGGATLIVPTPPGAPATPGSTSPQTLTLVPSTTTVASLTAPFNKDFSAAVGLDRTSLQNGRPRVRVTASMQGFEGQLLAGMGFTTGSGPTYPINASFSVPLFATLAPFNPTAWVMADAQDAAGNLSRVRVLLLPALSTTFESVPQSPLSIPVITAPSGPFTGSPAVTCVDPVDASVIIGGLGFLEVVAQDSGGRKWTVLVPDRDGTGSTDTVQFPDLNSAGVVGLQTGTWSMKVEARAMTSLTSEGPDDFVLSERIRLEVLYARSAAVAFSVQ